MSSLALTLLYLLAAVLGVVTCRSLKLPPMLGYLAAGVLIGPHALALAQNSEGVRHLGEFGVVFLMFAIGLEFSLPKLRSMRRHVFGLGLSQVVLTVLITSGASLLLTLLCRLGEQVRLLLDYSMTDTGAIFAQLASDPRFAPFGFLQGCDPAKTVTVATGLTARDDRELAAFLQRLGKSDLQNQLRLTDGYIAFAKGRAEEYAARCKRQKQLYVAFGLSGGLIAALLLA